jgi:hypothetical protein
MLHQRLQHQTAQLRQQRQSQLLQAPRRQSRQVRMAPHCNLQRLPMSKVLLSVQMPTTPPKPPAAQSLLLLLAARQMLLAARALCLRMKKQELVQHKLHRQVKGRVAEMLSLLRRHQLMPMLRPMQMQMQACRLLSRTAKQVLCLRQLHLFCFHVTLLHCSLLLKVQHQLLLAWTLRQSQCKAQVQVQRLQHLHLERLPLLRRRKLRPRQPACSPTLMHLQQLKMLNSCKISLQTAQ